MKYLLLITLLVSSITVYSQDKYEHIYSTYLGGNNFEQARDLAVDKDGNIYIAGGTSSPDFPVTQGAYQTQYNDAGSPSIGSWGPMMAFVSKFAPDGTLLWSTFLGGPNYDRAYAVEVDNNGYVYVGGRAGDDFPTTTGAVQEEFLSEGPVPGNSLYGHQNGFVTKLSPDGSEVIWSTYYGSENQGFFRDIDVDDEGNVYGILNAVLGKPFGIDEDSFDDTHNGKTDMVAVKFSNDGSNVEWASFIGGSNKDQGGPSIRVGPDKSVYVCGGTKSPDMPITQGAVQENYGGESDMFVARFSPDGSSLIYCTYFGGSDTEATETHGLFVDHLGQAYVACFSSSTDATTTSNAYKPNTNSVDCLLFKLSDDGTELMGSTYFGGNDGDYPEGIFVDKDQNMYFAGGTFSKDLPVTDASPFPDFKGNTSAFIVKLNSEFSEVEFCSYYGGSRDDAIRAFSLSDDGAICVSGQSNSRDLPTTDDAFQKDHIKPNNRPNVFLSIFKPDNETSVGTEQTEKFKIYPNPSESFVTVESTSVMKEIKLFDNIGNILLTEKNSYNNQLNVNGLSAGIYFIKIITDNGTHLKKLIIK